MASPHHLVPSLADTNDVPLLIIKEDHLGERNPVFPLQPVQDRVEWTPWLQPLQTPWSSSPALTTYRARTSQRDFAAWIDFPR